LLTIEFENSINYLTFYSKIFHFDTSVANKDIFQQEVTFFGRQTQLNIQNL